MGQRRNPNKFKKERKKLLKSFKNEKNDTEKELEIFSNFLKSFSKK